MDYMQSMCCSTVNFRPNITRGQILAAYLRGGGRHLGSLFLV